MLLGVFRFAKKMELFKEKSERIHPIRGKGIRWIFSDFPVCFSCMRGPSLVGLTGHDNSATLPVTVQLRMSLKYFGVFYIHNILLYSNMYSNIPRYINCCNNRFLQFHELGGFAWRGWFAFELLREALVRIGNNKLSRSPSSTVLDAHSNRFGRCAPKTSSLGHGYKSYKSFLV